MTDTVEWRHIRAKAIHNFGGELPRNDTEATIIEVFENAPEIVIAAIADVAEGKASGKVRSGWAVLHSRLEDALEPGRDVQATIGEDRQLRIRQAENWIRNAGIHCPTEDEIIHELYDARSAGHRNSSCALLHPWRDDDTLRERILNLWRTQRPKGEQVEREQVERAERWKAANPTRTNHPASLDPATSTFAAPDTDA